MQGHLHAEGRTGACACSVLACKHVTVLQHVLLPHSALLLLLRNLRAHDHAFAGPRRMRMHRHPHMPMGAGARKCGLARPDVWALAHANCYTGRPALVQVRAPTCAHAPMHSHILQVHHAFRCMCPTHQHAPRCTCAMGARPWCATCGSNACASNVVQCSCPSLPPCNCW